MLFLRWYFLLIVHGVKVRSLPCDGGSLLPARCHGAGAFSHCVDMDLGLRGE
jgi:hypothetical protein